MTKAVVFDLDDTLYPEIDYVKSGFADVARYVQENFGMEDAEQEFIELFEENHSNVFDRFAHMRGLSSEQTKQLVERYRNHMPNIALSDDVKNTLETLRKKGYKLGIITDGRPEGQKNKISALGLNNMVDKIIITDELGGIEYRKPHPRAFELMCKELGVAPKEMLYVGDNPQKDFAIKELLLIKTAHLKNNCESLYSKNEYRNGILPDVILNSIREIEALLENY